MDWKPYQTVDPLQKEPQVGRGLFGIRVLILHFKFQFSKSVKSSTFHIFLNLTYPRRKNLSFPKHLIITQKFTQNCQIVDNVISIRIWRRLKRDRDIGRSRKAVKTAFTLTPALNQWFSENSSCIPLLSNNFAETFSKDAQKQLARTSLRLGNLYFKISIQQQERLCTA